MRTTASTLTVLITAAMLMGTTATALAQASAEDHDAHHPEAAATPGPAVAQAAPQPESGPGMTGPGMMGPGMMGMMRGMMGPGMMAGGPEGEGAGMMGPGMMGMMGHGMMRHPGVMFWQPGVVVLAPSAPMMPGMMGMGMPPGMMGPGMMAPEAAEPRMMPGMMGPGMTGMMGPRMARGHGIGPGLLYGVPPQEASAERVRAMLEGLLAWHGNPRLELGEVQEEDGTVTAEIVTVDGSLLQRLAVDRDTGTFRRID